MNDDDDLPVTRERLKIELDILRTRLETERLERESRNLWWFGYALTFLIYFTLLVMMMQAILTRTK